MRISLVIFICFVIGFSHLSSQNIFDEETSEKPASAEPVEKPAKPKKKKKARKKKKPASSGEEASSSPKAYYSSEELAKSSYIWAPDAEPVTLLSSAPGMKAAPVKENAKPSVQELKPEQIEARPAGNQGFRLPQIPLAQVLIVAGFVILFLIYRVRVSSQIKRKKY